MRVWTAGILLTIGLATQAQAQERYVLGGGEVAIYNLAGRVTIEPGTGRDVTVEVRRGGRDAGRLKVETGELQGRQTLRVVYPGDQVVYPEMGRGSNTTLQVGRDGTFGDRSGAARKVRIRGSGGGAEAFADLVVRTPRGSRVTVHQAVGGVEARGVEADLVLDTHSATVTTERTRGRLKVDAGSGAVRVEDAAGEVEVDGGSGGIDVDVPVTTTRRERSHFRGRIGEGGGRVRIDTGSGSVRVVRGG